MLELFQALHEKCVRESLSYVLHFDGKSNQLLLSGFKSHQRFDKLRQIIASIGAVGKAEMRNLWRRFVKRNPGTGMPFDITLLKPLSVILEEAINYAWNLELYPKPSLDVPCDIEVRGCAGKALAMPYHLWSDNLRLRVSRHYKTEQSAAGAVDTLRGSYPGWVESAIVEYEKFTSILTEADVPFTCKQTTEQ